MARQPDVLGKSPGKTLGEALTRMAKLPVAPMPAQPAEPGRRGGADMGGSYELPLLPKQLPYWWPDR